MIVVTNLRFTFFDDLYELLSDVYKLLIVYKCENRYIQKKKFPAISFKP